MTSEELILRAKIAALDAALRAAQPGSSPQLIMAAARQYELYFMPDAKQP